MAKAPLNVKDSKQGESAGLELDAMELDQGAGKLYVFGLKASDLWNFLSIDRRNPDKKEGYQRILNASRVNAVKRYIAEGNGIPGAIIVALDGAKFAKGKLTIPPGVDVGWVIDGQHRLAGAHRAASEGGPDLELPVVAYIDITEDEQIRQFVTINREAKNVPTSLFMDLLPYIPKTDPSDLAKQRAHEVGDFLRKDTSSAFYDRIAIVDSPRKGQLSSTNFVRKVAPFVHPDKGIMRLYNFERQAKVLSNFYDAVKSVYWQEWKNSNNIFFQTVGFGAMMNCFEQFFNYTIQTSKSLTVDSFVATLSVVGDYEFELWRQLGSGNKAETQAASAFLTTFNERLEDIEDDQTEIPV